MSRTALLLVSGLLVGPQAADAALIQLGVSGGSGLDQGALCSTTSGITCPSSPTFQLAGGATAAGSFGYDSTANTASFTLTLSQDANFGGETLKAGSTVSGSAVPVSLQNLGKGLQEFSQTGAPLNGVANLTFGPGLSMIEGTPAISALSCTLGAKVDVCGVSLGAGGLEVGPDSNGVDYNGFLTFNVNAVPVPLPATAWLLLLGVGCYVVVRRPAARPSFV